MGESDENLQLMRLIDEQYLHTPFYGSRGMTQWLMRQGHDVNRKRVQRLMRVMGLEAIYPRRRTSVPCPEHRIYPYLLRNLAIERPDQVWSADITYVPLRQGFMYLVAVLDWHSRYVLSWELSNTLDSGFCVAALDAALARQQPEIFNTDQGSAVHQPGVHGRAGGGGRGDQHGWPRPGPRQRVHRAAVAEREVREHLPARLRDGGGVGARPGVVLRLLLLRAAAHGARLPHAVGGVLGGATCAASVTENFSAQKILACGQTLKDTST